MLSPDFVRSVDNNKKSATNSNDYLYYYVLYLSLLKVFGFSRDLTRGTQKFSHDHLIIITGNNIISETSRAVEF